MASFNNCGKTEDNGFAVRGNGSTTTIIETECDMKCHVCGGDTKFYDLMSQLAVCSEECEEKLNYSVDGVFDNGIDTSNFGSFMNEPK